MCGVGILSAPIAIRTYGWSETGFFCENTASQPAATSKTRFLGFTGGQKPGFWREYLVRARSNGKNPVSWVYGWPEIGVVRNRVFFGEYCVRACRNGKKPGFFGLRGVRNRVFWREYCVRACSNGKNPVSLVWFLWF